MANYSNSKFGFGLSFVITSIVTALLVVWKETNESLKSLMKEFTGHHWITHGILILVLLIDLAHLVIPINSPRVIVVVAVQAYSNL